MFDSKLLWKSKFFLAVMIGMTTFLIVNFAVASGYSLEVGQINIDHEWTEVQFKRPYANPVVVAKPLSYNRGDPATVRIRNVTPMGFEIRVQEWAYSAPGEHNPESVTYLVMEKGHQFTAPGLEVEAGMIETDAVDSFFTVKFSSRFGATPVVITSVTTVNGSDAVVTRNRNVTPTGFEVTMQEEEAKEPTHTTETISYVAWNPGKGTMSGKKFEVGFTGPIIDENFSPVNFWFNQSTTIQVDEEQSADSETGHAEEDVGYVAFAGSPLLLIADMQTTNGSDTANLRYGGVPQPIEEVETPTAAVPKGIIIQPPEQPKLDISISTDRPSYPIGSTLGVSCTVNEEAYIYVLHYDTQGVMRLIFPNKYSQNNLGGPGVLRLPDAPYQIPVSGPPGTQYIQAVASTKKVDIFNFAINPSNPFSENAFPIITNPQRLIDEIKTGLGIQFYWKPGEKPGLTLVPVKWDSAMTSFQITRGQVNIKPQAAFIFNPLRGNAGEAINFDASNSYDRDGYITQYNWDFNGDGLVDASGIEVINRYWATGQYNVKLTVRDNQGATNSITKTLQIGRANKQPVAEFSYSPANPIVGESVTFDASDSYDPDGYLTQYLWDFDGDGQSDASGKQVSYRFWRTGQFRTILTLHDNENTTATKSEVIQVSRPNRKPVARFECSPTDPSMGESVSFDASDSYDPDGYLTQYLWDFDGDGDINATGKQVTHRYWSSGQYSVKLIVEDNQGAEASITKAIRVKQPNQEPVAELIYSPTKPTVGEEVSFDASDSYDLDGYITQYLWDFDGDDRVDAYGRTVTHKYWSSGQFRVELTVQDNQGAEDFTTKLITVRSKVLKFASKGANYFYSAGDEEDGWHWNSFWGDYAQWRWVPISDHPKDAYINFHILVTNDEGASGLEAKLKLRVLNNLGRIIETGEVELSNPFMPQFSGDTNGVGYDTYGYYQIKDTDLLNQGFRVEIEWPPVDNRYRFGTAKTSTLLTYTY
jgi:PKD repeat protein